MPSHRRSHLATGLLSDARLAVRSLARSPGFSLATIASLSVGFALASSALAVANAYLARSFPYPNLDRLYHVRYAPPGPVEPRGMSTIDWSTARDVVAHTITTSGQIYYIAADDGARSARGLRVSPGFLQALGVRAAVGRTLGPVDFEAAAAPVAMIGHELWRDQFGADPRIVGRSLRVEPEGRSAEPELLHIVGVLPPGFWFGRTSADSVGVLVPLRSPATTYLVALREGVSVEHAQRRLTSIAADAATWLPPQWSGVELESLHERYVGPLRSMLRAIVVAAALVIALTCVSVAVLVLLRTMTRSRDVAVRVAHGAGRSHLLRLFMLETGIISAVAIVVGAALTRLSLRVMAPSIEGQLGKPSAAGPSAMVIDVGVAAAMAALVLFIALSLGVIPALVPWQRRLGAILRGDARVGADNQWTRRVRASLIALEVAGSVALLVGCGLMIHTAASFQSANLGVDYESVVRVRVVLRGSRYADPAAYERFYLTIAEQLSARGVRVAFSGWPPFIEHPTHTIEGGSPARALAASMVGVGPGYFATVGITVRQGRDFSVDDRQASEPVAVISESLARQLWPSGGAVGGRVRYVESRPSGAPEIPWRRVVGVVADARQTYQDQSVLDLYVPTLQSDPGRYLSMLAKTNLPAASVTTLVRSTVAAIDPTAVAGEARPVALEDTELARARFLRALLATFAVLTAFLSALGMYGVVAHGIRQREREVAIRVAIGATPSAIVALFLRESAGLLGVGILGGATAAVGLARVLETRMFSTAALDPVTMFAACSLMALVGLAAILEPVIRASRRSPMSTLHTT